MPPTTQEVYNEVLRVLSPPERLRLATLILNQLVHQDTPTIDQSDTWTDQDQADVVKFSLQYHPLAAIAGKFEGELWEETLAEIQRARKADRQYWQQVVEAQQDGS
jgi:hypothetical protein